MSLEVLTLGTFSTMDGGRIGAAFELELAQLERDCQNRPGLKKPRKLLLEIELTPEPVDGEQELERLKLEWSLRARTPVVSGRPAVVKVTPKGLLYNEASPQNPNQRTLDEKVEWKKPNVI